MSEWERAGSPATHFDRPRAGKLVYELYGLTDEEIVLVEETAL